MEKCATCGTPEDPRYPGRYIYCDNTKIKDSGVLEPKVRKNPYPHLGTFLDLMKHDFLDLEVDLIGRGLLD